MAYTSLLRFGSNVHIAMTRDVHRRISRFCTLLDEKEEGYLLETDGDQQIGALYILPSHQLHQSYKAGVVHSPHQRNDDNTKIEYDEWLNGCIQQATAWARSHAIQTANDSISEGRFAQASETYYDVMDHFPPPPDGPLLQWNYYRCVAKMDGIENAREGLLLWLHEALPIAGINVNSSILDPAKELLGEETATEAAKRWLEASSPHDPAHKMAKRWLDKQGQDGLLALSWKFGSENPLGTKNALLIPMQNGDVMAVGGLDSDENPSDRAAIWHHKTHTWTPISSLPCGLTSHMGLSLDKSTVIVAGGQSSECLDEYSRRVFVWNYTEDSWKEENPLHTGRRSSELILLHNGQLMILGGEDPLSSDTSFELWDRRSGTWKNKGSIGLCLPEVSLNNVHEKVLVTGASMSTSGFGAMIWNVLTEKWTKPDELRGLGIDGMIRLSDEELVVWSKKSGEIDIGVWSMLSKSVSWHCKDIELMTRTDLTNILQYDEDKFVLLSAGSEMIAQAQLINPTTGNMSELPMLMNHKIPMEQLSACSIFGGIFILHPTGWALL
jgi:hypothetical protein